MESNDCARFVSIVQKLAPRNKLLRKWELTGGSSAQVTAVEIQQADGSTKKLIVRQHRAAELENNPNVATDEYRLMELLQQTGVATPRPYFLDSSGEILPTPYLVMEFIEGQTIFKTADLQDLMLQFARELFNIHNITGVEQDLTFLKKLEDLLTAKIQTRPAQLDESLDEGKIRDVLESVWPLPQRNAPVLLHGDFWPGNVLWREGQLAAVLDWEDAQIGDPISDLANSRMEILLAFGLEAMQYFTDQYQSLRSLDCTDLPYWDLLAALRPASKIAEWAGDSATETRMRERHRLFITQAFENL